MPTTIRLPLDTLSLYFFEIDHLIGEEFVFYILGLLSLDLNLLFAFWVCLGFTMVSRWFMETKRSSEENEIMVWASKARRYYLLDRVASE